MLRANLILLVMASACAACTAGTDAHAGGPAQDETSSSGTTWWAAARGGRFELRRQNVDRGTDDESSKTTLRLEKNFAGALSRLRLDLPFPDEKDSLSGSLFNPRLGDIQIKAFFHPFALSGTKLAADVELTFPTADPPSKGTGRVQFGPALLSVPGAPVFVSASGQHRVHIDWTLRQTVSFAGDPARKDIHTTKPELALRDLIGSEHSLKLTFKPVIDWVQDGKTSAVLELEGDWNVHSDWRLTLLGGVGLWGQGVSGYYGRKFELVAGRRF